MGFRMIQSRIIFIGKWERVKISSQELVAVCVTSIVPSIDELLTIDGLMTLNDETHFLMSFCQYLK